MDEKRHTTKLPVTGHIISTLTLRIFRLLWLIENWWRGLTEHHRTLFIKDAVEELTFIVMEKEAYSNIIFSLLYILIPHLHNHTTDDRQSAWTAMWAKCVHSSNKGSQSALLLLKKGFVSFALTCLTIHWVIACKALVVWEYQETKGW